MPIAVSGSNIVFADGSSIASGFTGFKNRIINGAMVVDQRNAGGSVNPADGAYTLDRWKMLMYNSASKYTVQQNAGSVTPPAGFGNYMGITSSSAYSVASTDLYGIQQRIEGFNTSDLSWGTANAKTVTLSFWVRSSLTGTFGGSLMNNAGNRSYPFSYTINSANTWEYETITIPGDTSGTWVGATNGIGMVLYLMIGTGSTFGGTAGAWAAGEKYAPTGATSVVGTNGATFYITGVQLEAGSSATSFEYRPFTTELQLCQRYYCKTYNIGVVPGTVDGNGSIGGSGTGNLYRPIVNWSYPVQMRATPTITFYSPSTGTIGKARDDNSGADLDATSYRTGTSGTRWYPVSQPASGNDIFAQVVASIEL